MPVVLHILPQDGIGGAELAANSAARADESVHLHFLMPSANIARTVHPRIFHARSHVPFGLAALSSVVATIRRVKPDIVVFSLWKTFLAYMLVVLLFPGTRRAVMLHSERPAHALDRTCTAAMIRMAHLVWGDSASSLRRAHGTVAADRLREVSFLMDRLAGDCRTEPAPAFIYWGRLDPLKNIPLALELVKEVRDRFGSVSFVIIGPDAGSLDAARAKAAALGLEEDVTFLGYRTRDEIVAHARGARFFLQLSQQEGAAMSVMEAMQCGLVPVVTPVGQIAHYCRHMHDAVIFEDMTSTVSAIIDVLEDPEQYAEMNRAAAAKWTGTALYAEDFVAAASEAVGQPV